MNFIVYIVAAVALLGGIVIGVVVKQPKVPVTANVATTPAAPATVGTQVAPAAVVGPGVAAVPGTNATGVNAGASVSANVGGASVGLNTQAGVAVSPPAAIVPPKVGTQATAPAAPSRPSVTTVVNPGSNNTQTSPSVSRVVYINGRQLTEADLSNLEQQYGVKPEAGRYWYDSVSGLYGLEGQGSVGFMLPGHAFGSLAANASNGTSGVFFNGRQLTGQEVSLVEAIIRTTAVPGRYFLDAAGNVGYEGTNVPLVNLYATGGGGGGGGGDNFWSSRFSAGNSNADNSQGYVSVPGYGPVGYGF